MMEPVRVYSYCDYIQIHGHGKPGAVYASERCMNASCLGRPAGKIGKIARKSAKLLLSRRPDNSIFAVAFPL